jgi:predicted transcriptional regulator/transcriptional regulator with XRE-family HTH domain
MSDETGRKILAGARLRRLRRELALSQTSMALELGISVSYLNLMERNQRPVTAQVLIRLAEVYDVDPRSFAREEELRAASELEEVFADPLFRAAPVPRTELREAADVAPSLVAAIQRLYRAYVESRESGEEGGADDDRSDGRPDARGRENPVERVRDFLHSANNHFPELEDLAERLASELSSSGHELFYALSERLREKHGLRVQVLPVEVMSQALRRFDRHRRRIMISELVEPSGRTFQAAYQLAFIECDAAIDAIAMRLDPTQGPARRLLRVTLGNYFAAALMMPYARFLQAAEALDYDVEVLSARFSASFEQVAHRLTTLARPTARGVPFFLVRVDTAGNVSKRFSSGSFPFSRFGGTCPRWNLHQTFRSPGRVVTDIVELPDGARWFSVSRTVRRTASPWGEPEAQFVIGLGCELRYAGRLVYSRGLDLKTYEPTPIGINCRLCERQNCAQRAAPPMMRALHIDESIRGVSPFDFEP